MDMVEEGVLDRNTELSFSLEVCRETKQERRGCLDKGF